MIPTRSRNAACSLPQALEPGRRRPAEAPLIRAGAPPRTAGLEVVGPLPAVLRSEDAAQILQTAVQSAGAVRAAPLVRVVRVAEVVVVLVCLARRFRRVDRVPVGAAEAPGAVGADVDLGLPAGHPLRDRLSDPSRTAEAVQGEPGRHPEPTYAGDGAEQRLRIRRHGVRMADERDDLGLGEEREPARGAAQQLLESGQVGRQRTLAVIPGDAVEPAGDGIRLVAAEHDAARLGLPVDEVVRVAEARHVSRQLVPRHGLQENVLVIDRRGRHGSADHGRDLRGPDAAGVHDDLRLDAAPVGLDSGNLAVRAELDARHARACEQRDTGGACGVCERVGRGVRVEEAVLRNPDGAVERLGRRGGHDSNGVLGREELDVEPDSFRPADASA